MAAVCLAAGTMLMAQEGYQRPPKVLEDMALAPNTPNVIFNDDYSGRLQLQANNFLSLEQLAQPELRLAGARINSDTYSESRLPGYSKVDIVTTDAKGKETTVTVSGLPQGSVIWNASWYAKDSRVLILNKEKDGIYLYGASATDGVASRLTSRRMNATGSTAVYWLNDTDFVMQAIPQGDRRPPVESNVPSGPVIQENLGTSVPARTYQDLLKNPYDEQLFEFYFTSQLVKVTPNGEQEIGSPAIFSRMSMSPDKSFFLVETIEKPYSYTVPMSSFPSVTKIIDLDGKQVKELSRKPVVVTAMGYDTTSPYPRQFAWRPDKPATVYWVEAQDGGDPNGKTLDYYDIVYQQAAPFTGEKQVVVKTEKRYRGIQWCDDELALVSQSSRATRRNQTFSFKPGAGGPLTLVFDLSTDDLYNDLGSPLTVKNQYNRQVLYTDKAHSELLLISQGASPEGEMPYISRYDLNKKQNTILWRCRAPYYEYVYAVKDPAKLQIITSRESQTEPANFYLKDLKRNKETAITAFPNPYPMMEGVTKEKIKYKRADGLDLSATVYLPAGYDKERDGRLPVLLWGYPMEYRSMADAAQVRGSEYHFATIGYRQPAMFVTRGYCVMEGTEMPIVGTETEEPNDTYIEQLVMDAEAAVKAITEMGVGDPDRIGVGGHSYGAFMTGNLMTHSKLFKAGIARSGAYNRTLTPFGFQSETRTYWQAPEVYNNMSPFMYADQLSGALLLVHGELDNNTGTFPIQSERFYQALKGHKATVRYVVLPMESHHYSAKENVLHLLYEQDAWLEKYVKNAK